MKKILILLLICSCHSPPPKSKPKIPQKFPSHQIIMPILTEKELKEIEQNKAHQEEMKQILKQYN